MMYNTYSNFPNKTPRNLSKKRPSPWAKILYCAPKKNRFEGILPSHNVVGIGISVVGIIVVGILPVPPHLGDVVIIIIVIVFVVFVIVAVVAVIVIVVVIVVCENKKTRFLSNA